MHGRLIALTDKQFARRKPNCLVAVMVDGIGATDGIEPQGIVERRTFMLLARLAACRCR